jgi:hypothetical protein
LKVFVEQKLQWELIVEEITDQPNPVEQNKAKQFQTSQNTLTKNQNIKRTIVILKEKTAAQDCWSCNGFLYVVLQMVSRSRGAGRHQMNNDSHDAASMYSKNINIISCLSEMATLHLAVESC